MAVTEWGRQGGTGRDLPFAVYSPNGLEKSVLAQAEARSSELHLGLSRW